MAFPGLPPGSTDLLKEWHRKSVIRRMLLPGDFMEKADVTDIDTFQCRRKTTETLRMKVRQRTRVVKRLEANRYPRNSQFRPTEFRNLTVTSIANPKEVSCGGCSGRGRNSCPTQMWCRNCKGSTRYEVQCNNCGGTGNNPVWPQHDCGYCKGGRREVDCGECDFGRVTCERCEGYGYTSCDRCNAEGILIQANFITRQFRSTVNVAFQLPGLAENKFKHGLSRKHFKRIPGDLVDQQWDRAQGRNAVMTRTSLHSYDLTSQECTYKGKAFHLNRIDTRQGAKYVNSRLPLSIRRTLLGGTFAVSVLTLASLLGVAKWGAIGIVVYGFLIALGVVEMSQWLSE